MGCKPGEVRPRRAARIIAGDEADRGDVDARTRTVWRWCRDGVLPCRVDEVGRYYVRKDLVEYIRDNPRDWRGHVTGADDEAFSTTLRALKNL